ncbi:hypothetical protein PPO43_04580 [Saprospira sp. CCB-QB6]|uniref:hypothetical protein n=1 Tax=Saprospira sp. CCB-QB6 TaxID=3023936 RepID=UPI00234BACAA|nr:hypothetical protein [Saprospira sp. CCB-QB6]WCL82376.1 hypothetical protein PPO43_04580 [Saprospira sp. CCB-QB6]
MFLKYRIIYFVLLFLVTACGPGGTPNPEVNIEGLQADSSVRGHQLHFSDFPQLAQLDEVDTKLKEVKLFLRGKGSLSSKSQAQLRELLTKANELAENPIQLAYKKEGQDRLYLQLETEEEIDIELQFFDQDGFNRLAKETIPIKNGKTNLVISTSSLEEGPYILTVANSLEIIYLGLVKV